MWRPGRDHTCVGLPWARGAPKGVSLRTQAEAGRHLRSWLVMAYAETWAGVTARPQAPERMNRKKDHESDQSECSVRCRAFPRAAGLCFYAARPRTNACLSNRYREITESGTDRFAYQRAIRYAGASNRRRWSAVGLAKSKLSVEDFSKVSKAVPGMDGLLKAAPKPKSSSPLDSLASSLPGSRSELASVASLFKSLGLSPGMAGKFVPVLTQYVQAKGGSTVVSLAGALK